MRYGPRSTAVPLMVRHAIARACHGIGPRVISAGPVLGMREVPALHRSGRPAAAAPGRPGAAAPGRPAAAAPGRPAAAAPGQPARLPGCPVVTLPILFPHGALATAPLCLASRPPSGRPAAAASGCPTGVATGRCSRPPRPAAWQPGHYLAHPFSSWWTGRRATVTRRPTVAAAWAPCLATGLPRCRVRQLGRCARSATVAFNYSCRCVMARRRGGFLLRPPVTYDRVDIGVIVIG
ncbi:hypothetical protein BU14_0049s0011 [Porphyra umbilicalis]|uniref:Uncharacterized protein n=1 Tax=Porphyra umbilicalis TaxID=2786 RepID=A0A1X6PIA0_PORUM|nr:hypothetical protein BU14_0049s0011 [Porphyra umbilicalis]|eukprot:OSX80567.1 hypothetical protein BU14_0049s0011 [Porphyra umbilicalis]